jgi:tetratricopeptide (TPR) repeat protein
MLGAMPLDPPAPALIEAELDRIATSDGFARSPRQVRLLRHLLRATGEGDLAALREFNLGVELLGRDPARFDPRSDSAVRVEARRLRQRLTAYYADEGLDARLEFRLPVGGYQVEIHRREVLPPHERSRASVVIFDLTGPDHAALPPGSVPAGLTTELAGLLARLNGLRVVLGGAVAPAPVAQREAARALGVEALLTGQLLWDAKPARLDLRLVRVDDLALLWVGEQALEPRDAAGLTAGLLHLARRLVSELHHEADRRAQQRIGPASARQLRAAATTPQVLEHLALARAAMQQGTLAGCDKAVELAQTASTLDPAWAPALAVLAEAQVGRAGMTVVPSGALLEAGRAAALRALELDPELAAAHGVMGQIRLLADHDWPGAEAGLLAALRGAPGQAKAHARYGWALMMNRRFAGARAAYLEARDLDPLSLNYRAHEALISLYERRWDEAASGLDAVLAVAPGHVVSRSLRASLHLYSGELAAATQAYQALHRELPALSLGECGLAQAAALAGNLAAAQTHLASLLARHQQGWVSPYQFAMVTCRLGRADEALAWLEQAATAPDFNFVCAPVDPSFDALHAHPGWAPLLQRHGMGHLV